jgi:hypothetical protein
MGKKEHSLVLYLSFQLIVQHLDFRLSCMHVETDGSAHFSKISPLTTTTHINVHICTSKLFALCALQKYRQYLKRLSAVASQKELVESRQAKIVIQPSSSVNSQRLECTAGVSSSLMDSHVSQQSGLSLSAFSASALPMNGSLGSTNVTKLGAA